MPGLLVSCVLTTDNRLTYCLSLEIIFRIDVIYEKKSNQTKEVEKRWEITDLDRYYALLRDRKFERA